MECTKCKTQTKVISTCHTNGRSIKQPKTLSNEDNFTMRRMKCTKCKCRLNSIEITCDDYDRLRERFRNDLLSEIQEKIGEIT